MAHLDFYANPGGGYLLDVQCNDMSVLSTRVVVPLMPLSKGPKPAKDLNPVFEIGDKRFVMVTQYMAAVPLSELRTPVGSLALERDAILKAIDMIFTGF